MCYEEKFGDLREKVEDLEERLRLTERARWETEAKQQAILNAFDGLVYICSRDFRIEYMNEAMVRRTGYDATGDYCYKALHGLEAVCPWCVNDRVFRGEKVRWETLSPKDGRWYQIVNTPIFHPDGTLSKQALIRDITECKEAEAALQESEQRFRSTFEQAAVGLVHMSPDQVWLRVNGTFCEFLGYSPDELSRLKVLDITHPDDFAVEGGQIRKLLDGTLKHFTLEKRYIRKDATLVWASLTVSLLRDDSGAPKYFIGVVKDISDSKRVEADREKLLHELDTIIHSIADGVLIYGREGEILRMNPTAEQMLGPKSEQSLPCHERVSLFRVETPGGAPLPLEEVPCRRALQGETVSGVILVIRRTGKPPLWISASAAPLCIGGENTGAIVTVTDLTRFHDLQEQIKVYTHTISHDLRTPLTVIRGHAEILLEVLKTSEGPVRKSIEKILQGSKRMNRLIEDLLDVARGENGKLILNRFPLDLRDFLPQMIDRSAEGSDLGRFILDIPPDLSPVLADADRIERVLMNLISNALKFSPPGSPVTIRVRSTEDDEIVTAVSDDGKGIEPGELARIFDWFYRSPSERTTGMGLGLYIARMLVEAHGGRIWAENNPGGGSKFSFTLPKMGTSFRANRPPSLMA